MNKEPVFTKKLKKNDVTEESKPFHSVRLHTEKGFQKGKKLETNRT